MKKLTVLLLAVLMVLTLAACQKPTDAPVSDSVAGTYVLTAANQDGTDIALEGMEPMLIVLNEDQTGTYGPAEGAMNITWSAEGESVTLVSEEMGPDEPFVLTYHGTTLSGTTDGLTMVFTKQ